MSLWSVTLRLNVNSSTVLLGDELWSVTLIFAARAFAGFSTFSTAAEVETSRSLKCLCLSRIRLKERLRWSGYHLGAMSRSLPDRNWQRIYEKAESFEMDLPPSGVFQPPPQRIGPRNRELGIRRVRATSAFMGQMSYQKCVQVLKIYFICYRVQLDIVDISWTVANFTRSDLPLLCPEKWNIPYWHVKYLFFSDSPATAPWKSVCLCVGPLSCSAHARKITELRIQHGYVEPKISAHSD